MGKETVLQLKEEEKSPARSGNLSPEINYHLFSFAHIQVKVQLVTPFCEIIESRTMAILRSLKGRKDTHPWGDPVQVTARTEDMFTNTC